MGNDSFKEEHEDEQENVRHADDRARVSLLTQRTHHTLTRIALPLRDIEESIQGSPIRAGVTHRLRRHVRIACGHSSGRA